MILVRTLSSSAEIFIYSFKGGVPMKLKKLASLVLAGSMLLSLTACGGSGADSTTAAKAAEETKAAAAAETTAAATEAAKKEESGEKRIAYIVGNLGDKSFNDSGEVGMNTLRSQGWDCKTVEVGDETKADKWEDLILDVIDEGYYYIVASSTYTDIMLRLAEEYPDKRFVIFDDSKDESEIPENVAFIFYAQNEGSYMVGQMAAGMTKSKVVAVNVGMDNPVIADFVTGFINGVQDYDPEVKVIKAAVGSWTDPAKMKELCLSQARDKKADIFYQVAGGSGGGLFEACKELGTWAIGVDSDQALAYEGKDEANFIISSAIKGVGDSIYNAVEKAVDGTLPYGEYQILGIEDGVVGLADNDIYQSVVSDDAKKAVEDAKEKLLSGEVKVDSAYGMDEATLKGIINGAQ